MLAFGDLHLLVTPQFPNMSALVMNLYYPQLPVGRSLDQGAHAGRGRWAVDGQLEDISAVLARAATGADGRRHA